MVLVKATIIVHLGVLKMQPYKPNFLMVKMKDGEGMRVFGRCLGWACGGVGRSAFVRTCVEGCACVHMCMCLCRWVCVCVCVCVHMHTRVGV